MLWYAISTTVMVVLPILKITGYLNLKWEFYAILIAIFAMFGAYEYGKKVMYDIIQVEVTVLKEKIDHAEIESEKTNMAINNTSNEIIRKIETKTNTVIQYIDREVTKYDNSCVIPNEVITAHNDAAKESK